MDFLCGGPKVKPGLDSAETPVVAPVHRNSLEGFGSVAAEG